MILLVCGDRHWKDRGLIAQEIDKVRRQCRDGELITLVEGEADGADKMARQYALKVGILVHPHPARWDQLGFAAGMIRNEEMLAEHPDLVLAFHDDIASSKGTAGMIYLAKQAGVPVRLISH